MRIPRVECNLHLIYNICICLKIVPQLSDLIRLDNDSLKSIAIYVIIFKNMKINSIETLFTLIIFVNMHIKKRNVDFAWLKYCVCVQNITFFEIMLRAEEQRNSWLERTCFHKSSLVRIDDKIESRFILCFYRSWNKSFCCL